MTDLKDSASKPKRVHKSADERRSEILTVATEIFAERGYQVADMQAVADAAGVGKGTVYRYFPTKEELFTETLRFNLEQLKTEIDTARHGPSEPIEQLKEGMRAYILYFEKNPNLTELFVQERAEFRDKAASLYFAYASEGRESWRGLFEEIAATYPLRPIDLEELMNICGDLMHGAVVKSQCPLDRKPLSERFETLFDVYLHGIMER
ncbi:TetR/AcrR family transcriptional regulator [Marinimicrobium agarilyticum]|uniref:TetR/AcrR family transcriptional regulator n=1 Tax=Marinimicrobium agarilyticum TaxID=306546 RepID=UPI000412B8C2|nr:TetR/AcrR family transcriptional regulator [Marinimicrobium agarilyticum]